MSYTEAIEILNRVKNGDTTPSLSEITKALFLTGDIGCLHDNK